MSVIWSGKGTDLERSGFSSFITVESTPVVVDTRIVFSGKGTDLERSEYTIITEDELPTPAVIFISCKGLDAERLEYTKTFEPTPTRIKGGQGSVENYTVWYSGLGDISGDLAEYTNRNGVYPNGGTGVL